MPVSVGFVAGAQHKRAVLDVLSHSRLSSHSVPLLSSHACHRQQDDPKVPKPNLNKTEPTQEPKGAGNAAEKPSDKAKSIPMGHEQTCIRQSLNNTSARIPTKQHPHVPRQHQAFLALHDVAVDVEVPCQHTQHHLGCCITISDKPVGPCAYVRLAHCRKWSSQISSTFTEQATALIPPVTKPLQKKCSTRPQFQQSLNSNVRSAVAWNMWPAGQILCLIAYEKCESERACLPACVSACALACLLACERARLLACERACAPVCSCACARYIYIYTYIYIYIYLCIYVYVCAAVCV